LLRIEDGTIQDTLCETEHNSEAKEFEADTSHLISNGVKFLLQGSLFFLGLKFFLSLTRARVHANAADHSSTHALGNKSFTEEERIRIELIVTLGDV